jgi:hypothetical protein
MSDHDHHHPHDWKHDGVRVILRDMVKFSYPPRQFFRFARAPRLADW